MSLSTDRMPLRGWLRSCSSAASYAPDACEFERTYIQSGGEGSNPVPDAEIEFGSTFSSQRRICRCVRKCVAPDCTSCPLCCGFRF